MSVTEQDFRNFRLFYRQRANGGMSHPPCGNRHLRVAVALNFLYSRDHKTTQEHYLQACLLADGIFFEEPLQAVRYHCNNRMIRGN